MKRIEAVIVQSLEYPERVSIRGADGGQGFREALRDGGFVAGDRVVVVLAQDYRDDRNQAIEMIQDLAIKQEAAEAECERLRAALRGEE